jgi:phosphoserine phosphatase RsbU/P
MASMHRRMVPGGVARAALLLGVLVFADIIVPDIFFAGYFGVAALIAAVSCGPSTVAVIGMLAEAATIMSGVWDGRFGSGQHVAVCVLTAVQAAVAVGVSLARRRREAELGRVRAVADVAQRALLPAVPGTLDGVGFAARYLSAAQEALIGGDLYEVVATPRTVRLIIGDVRGKGLPAVRLSTIVLGAFREAAMTWLEVEQVAAACGRAVAREAGPEDFVTALVVDIHADGTLRMLSAGHPPPLLISDGKATTLPLGTPSPPFGIAETYRSTQHHWEPGDRLLMFTDGLIEARDHRGAFFPLHDHLHVLSGVSLEESLDMLTTTLHTHVGGNLHDDLALLVAERMPVRTPASRSVSTAPPSTVTPSTVPPDTVSPDTAPPDIPAPASGDPSAPSATR